MEGGGLGKSLVLEAILVGYRSSGGERGMGVRCERRQEYLGVKCVSGAGKGEREKNVLM